MNPPASRVNSAINITPLVDVMLVLLIIFLVVTPLVGQGVDVTLPETAAPPAIDPQAAKPLIVSIHFAGDPGRGEIFLGETPVADAAALGRELDALAAREPGREISLRADARLTFAAVRPVMKTLQEHGHPAANLAAAQRAAR